jgi:protein SCO1/2
LAASLLIALVAAATLVGCNLKKNSAVSGGERRYPIEGQVVAVDPAMHTLTLDHRDIPGYMTAMTMSFTVRDGWVFNVVHPGDVVQATLVVDHDSVLENVAVTQSRSAADLSSTSPMHLPQRGEAVPDFALVDQNGRPIHLGQFRGEPLLVTFIYSRCPVPDYCIRMSNNFAEVARTVQKSGPGAFAKLQMLSVTIDPGFDDPKVLRDYGKNYAADVDPKLKHWTFATGSPEQIRQTAEFFGLSYASQSGQIIHNLRTALVDADGKIHELYSGNRWKPAEVAQELEHLQR